MKRSENINLGKLLIEYYLFVLFTKEANICIYLISLRHSVFFNSIKRTRGRECLN